MTRSVRIFPKVQNQLHRIGGSNLGVATVVRVRGATGRLAIDYAITDGTAKAGEHYALQVELFT